MFNRFRETVEPMALIMRLGAIVVAAVFLPLGLGLLVDNRFGTSPFGLLIGMLLGVVLSIVGVYRAVKQMYDRYSPPKEGK